MGSCFEKNQAYVFEIKDIYELHDFIKMNFRKHFSGNLDCCSQTFTYNFAIITEITLMIFPTFNNLGILEMNHV